MATLSKKCAAALDEADAGVVKHVAYELWDLAGEYIAADPGRKVVMALAEWLEDVAADMELEAAARAGRDNRRQNRGG